MVKETTNMERIGFTPTEMKIGSKYFNTFLKNDVK